MAYLASEKGYKLLTRHYLNECDLEKEYDAMELMILKVNSVIEN